MIKLNLATKPGLQPIEVQDPQINIPVMAAQPRGPELDSVTASPEELLQTAEKQLETMEREEEFIPRHVSLPPQAKKTKVEAGEEAEETVAATPAGKTRRRHKLEMFLIAVTLLILLAMGGWVGYQYYAKKAVGGTFLQSTWDKIRKITQRETARPETETNVPTPSDTVALSMTHTLSQEVTRQAVASSYIVEHFSQLLDFFPPGTRFQRVKLNTDRVLFIAFMTDDSAVARFKNSLLNSGDYETPEVLQAAAVAEGKQLVGVIQIKSPFISPESNLPAYSDDIINQKVWDLARKAQIELQPLTLYCSDPELPHEVEINAAGEVKNCSQFIRELAEARLNWSLSSVVLNSADLDKAPSSQVKLNLRAIIYPPEK